MVADSQQRTVRSGPLVGMKVIELAGIGPAPFAGMMLASLELNLDPSPQSERVGWPEVRTILAARFRGKTPAQWSNIFETSDACVAPVVLVAKHAYTSSLRPGARSPR
jgi:crotonobetainyl-CoA:carnitine CoA-transferase CaiB-like acyl-CoA transferase